MLDITATVTEDFLDRYGLNSNDSILATERHENLFQDVVTNHQVGIFPGGQTLNVIRCAKVEYLGYPSLFVYN